MVQNRLFRNPENQAGSLADPDACADTYLVSDILAERLVKGEQQWLVRWDGYGPNADTWAPLENLTGCEQFIAQFNHETEQKDQKEAGKTKRLR